MPRPKPWIGRIPQILKVLEESEAPHLTRAEVEQLFEIGRSAATDLMKVAGVATSRTAAGCELLVTRVNLLQFLKHGPEGQAAEQEARRRANLAKKLQDAAAAASLRAIRLPVDPNVDYILRELANVSIEDGVLQVAFSDATDLMCQLYKLCQAAGRDWAEFEKLCEMRKEKAG